MSGTEGFAGEIQPGMPVYSADGERLGVVDGHDEDGIRVNGQPVAGPMIARVTPERVEVRYIAPQFLWQSRNSDEQHDGVGYDPSDSGLLDQMARQPRDGDGRDRAERRWSNADYPGGEGDQPPPADGSERVGQAYHPGPIRTNTNLIVGLAALIIGIALIALITFFIVAR